MTRGTNHDRRPSQIVFKTAKQILEEQENGAGLTGRTIKPARTVDTGGIYYNER